MIQDTSEQLSCTPTSMSKERLPSQDSEEESICGCTLSWGGFYLPKWV